MLYEQNSFVCRGVNVFCIFQVLLLMPIYMVELSFEGVCLFLQHFGLPNEMQDSSSELQLVVAAQTQTGTKGRKR